VNNVKERATNIKTFVSYTPNVSLKKYLTGAKNRAIEHLFGNSLNEIHTPPNSQNHSTLEWKMVIPKFADPGIKLEEKFWVPR
jgi:hypothetical protein